MSSVHELEGCAIFDQVSTRVGILFEIQRYLAEMDSWRVAKLDVQLSNEMSLSLDTFGEA